MKKLLFSYLIAVFLLSIGFSCSTDYAEYENVETPNNATLKSVSSVPKTYFISNLSGECRPMTNEAGIFEDVEIKFSEPLQYDAVVYTEVYKPKDGNYCIQPFNMVSVKAGSDRVILSYSCDSEMLLMPFMGGSYEGWGIVTRYATFIVEVTNVKYLNGQPFDYSLTSSTTNITAIYYITGSGSV